MGCWSLRACVATLSTRALAATLIFPHAEACSSGDCVNERSPPAPACRGTCQWLFEQGWRPQRSRLGRHLGGARKPHPFVSLDGFGPESAQQGPGAILVALPVCLCAHLLPHSTSRMWRHVPVGTSVMSGACPRDHAEGCSIGASCVGGGLEDPACADIWAEPANVAL